MKTDGVAAVRTLEHLSGKWRVGILVSLMRGRKRFGELRDELGDVTSKVLAENLHRMEQEGLVARVVYAEVPPRTEYALTEAGYGFQGVFTALSDWDRRYGKRQPEKRS